MVGHFAPAHLTQAFLDLLHRGGHWAAAGGDQAFLATGARYFPLLVAVTGEQGDTDKQQGVDTERPKGAVTPGIITKTAGQTLLQTKVQQVRAL